MDNTKDINSKNVVINIEKGQTDDILTSDDVMNNPFGTTKSEAKDDGSSLVVEDKNGFNLNHFENVKTNGQSSIPIFPDVVVNNDNSNKKNKSNFTIDNNNTNNNNYNNNNNNNNHHYHNNTNNVYHTVSNNDADHEHSSTVSMGDDTSSMQIANNDNFLNNLPSADDQLKAFNRHADNKGDNDNTDADGKYVIPKCFCAIDVQWYAKWKAYVYEPSKNQPPTISFVEANAQLAAPSGLLKMNVQENVHYEIVTEKQFDLFNIWYNPDSKKMIQDHEFAGPTNNFLVDSKSPGYLKTNAATKYKVIGYSYAESTGIEWRPCRFNIYQSEPEIYTQVEKYFVLGQNQSFNLDMTLKEFILHVKKNYVDSPLFETKIGNDWRVWIRLNKHCKDDYLFINATDPDKINYCYDEHDDDDNHKRSNTKYFETGWLYIHKSTILKSEEGHNNNNDTSKNKTSGNDGDASKAASWHATTRLYDVCRSLLSVDEDVCNLQNKFNNAIFEILIECWRPDRITGSNDKNKFFKGKLCSLKYEINSYNASKNQVNENAGSDFTGLGSTMPMCGKPKIVQIRKLWSSSQVGIHSADIDRLTNNPETRTIKKQLDFKKDVLFASNINLIEKNSDEIYCDDRFKLNPDDSTWVCIHMPDWDTGQFMKIVDIKRVLLVDEFSDGKRKECTCLKVTKDFQIESLDKGFLEHEMSDYFEVYSNKLVVNPPSNWLQDFKDRQKVQKEDEALAELVNDSDDLSNTGNGDDARNDIASSLDNNFDENELLDPNNFEDDDDEKEYEESYQNFIKPGLGKKKKGTDDNENNNNNSNIPAQTSHSLIKDTTSGNGIGMKNLKAAAAASITMNNNQKDVVRTNISRDNNDDDDDDYLSAQVSTTAVNDDMNGSSSSLVISKYKKGRKPFSWKDIMAKAEEEYNETPGVCGLSNIGNTCFMNSMLQCLSNAETLTTYFLSKQFKRDINEDNILGTQGEMASKYFKLMKKMWYGKESSVMPSELKYLIGRIQPQFRGYRQHDAQELCIFLLDALHEDLNMIKKKPYIEEKDPLPGTPEVEIAETAWCDYSKRNKSFIVDKFYGQLRSHITCNECNFEAVKFDPFSCLSVPIPKNTSISFPRIFVSFDECSNIMQIDNIVLDENHNNLSVNHLLCKVTELISSNNAFNINFEVLNISDVRNMHLYRIDKNGNLKAQYNGDVSLLDLHHDFSRTYNNGNKIIIFVRSSKFDEALILQGNEKVVDRFLKDSDRQGNFVEPKKWRKMLLKKSREVFYIRDQNRFPSLEVLIGHTWNFLKKREHATGISDYMYRRQNVQVLHNVSDLINNQLVRIQVVHRVQKNDNSNSNNVIGSRNKRRYMGNMNYNNQYTSYSRANYTVLTNTWLMLEYTDTPLIDLASNIHKRIKSSKWHEHITVKNNDSSGGGDVCEDDAGKDNQERSNKARRKSLSQTSPHDNDSGSSSFGGGGGGGDGGVGNNDNNNEEIIPHDNKYYRLDIHVPDNPSSTFDYEDFDCEDGEAFNELIQNYSHSGHGPFVGQKARRCSDDIVDCVVFVTWKNQLAHDSFMRTRKGSVVSLRKHLRFLKHETHQRQKKRKNSCVDDKERACVRNADVDDIDNDNGQLTLYKLLQLYSKREQLSENDKYYCPKCKEHVRAFKKLDIWKAPEILIIQLKRFEYVLRPSYYGNDQRAERSKLEDEVFFPTGDGSNGGNGGLLNLKRFIKGPSGDTDNDLYELFAVSEHSGGLGGGHYTASAKNFLTNQWYKFNDSYVHPLHNGPNNIDRQNAYVLFYKRHDTKSPSDSKMVDLVDSVDNELCNGGGSSNSSSSSSASIFGTSIFSSVFNNKKKKNDNATSHIQKYSSKVEEDKQSSTSNRISNGSDNNDPTSNSFNNGDSVQNNHSNFNINMSPLVDTDEGSNRRGQLADEFLEDMNESNQDPDKRLSKYGNNQTVSI